MIWRKRPVTSFVKSARLVLTTPPCSLLSPHPVGEPSVALSRAWVPTRRRPDRCAPPHLARRSTHHASAANGWWCPHLTADASRSLGGSGKEQTQPRSSPFLQLRVGIGRLGERHKPNSTRPGGLSGPRPRHGEHEAQLSTRRVGCGWGTHRPRRCAAGAQARAAKGRARNGQAVSRRGCHGKPERSARRGTGGQAARTTDTARFCR